MIWKYLMDKNLSLHDSNFTLLSLATTNSSLPSRPTGKRHLVVSTAQINYLNWFSKTSIIGWHKASK